MSIESIYEKQEDIPEGFQEHYVERDGKFELQVSGLYSQIDIDNLKGALVNERGVSSGLRGKLSNYGEHTPESVEALETSHADFQLRAEANHSPDTEGARKKQDEIISQRINASVKPWERKYNQATGLVETLRADNAKLVARENHGKIIRAARDAMNTFEVLPSVMDDVDLYAQHNFEISDGRVVTNSNAPMPGLTPAEHFKDMKNEGRRAHWFGPTQGAGAIGGENPSDMGDNPFMPGKHYNMTNQARLMTADPALAEKMKKAAENYAEREARLAARK